MWKFDEFGIVVQGKVLFASALLDCSLYMILDDVVDFIETDRQNRQDKPIDMLHRVDNVILDRSQEYLGQWGLRNCKAKESKVH
jgi:hypothetical protein